MKLSFTGATETVTGSQYLINTEGKRYLVDFGLYQGPEPISRMNRREFPWEPSEIQALFLTHAHMDHSGMIPWLVRHGFKGRVHCTPETFELCKILLVDSGKIQEDEYKREFKRNEKAQKPLYTQEDAINSFDYFVTHDFKHEFHVDHLKASFTRAGHIPGAASLRLVTPQTSVIFSGDIGRYDDPLMYPPEAPPSADYVVMETTYGNRLHNTNPPEEKLIKYLELIKYRSSKLIVPTFAVARAQLLIHLFQQVFHQRPDLKVPFFVHSPMTEKVTNLYKDFHMQLKIDESEVHSWDEFARFIHWKKESENIDRKPGPAIIMAASGMVSGGKIVEHLKELGDEEQNIILLTGYQAEGTPGREILEGSTRLKISDVKIEIKAEVHVLKSLSAHADGQGLHRWLDAISPRPKKVFLSHGEEDGREGFAELISKDGYEVEIPPLDAVYNLI